MKNTVARLSLRPMLFAVAVAVAAGCQSNSGGGAASRDSATAAGRAGAIDTASLPVTITLRRDSLGVAANAPADSVRAAIDRAVARLQRASEFEVLAVSAPILAIQVRARGAGGSQALANALRAHPLVAAAEVESVMRAPPP